MTELETAAQVLREAGYSVKEPPPPPPINKCHWCGKTDEDNEDDGYGLLVDITVITADDEEGYARELRYACQEHLVEKTRELIRLGFGSHRHGGINFLEDDRCPAFHGPMEACPTPEVEDYD